MRKALTITLVATLALFAGSAAYANWCARDVVPASTLLVPYAVQDMTGQYTPSPDGYTTILTVTNVSKDAQIIHITVWSADSNACLDFNEVLTGYDVWQIFFRDMLAGNFGLFDTSMSSTASPNTGNRTPFEWGPDGRSAYSGLNKTGLLPTPDKTTGFTTDANCYMPYGNGLTVTSNVDCLRAPLFQRTHAGCTWVTGNNTTTALKVRADYNNDWLKNIPADKNATDPIWFYVTVDVVNACNFEFPSSLDYFGQTGFYKPVNVLIGDIVYLDKANNFSESFSAVHLESDPIVDNPPYFYGEKAQGDTINLSLEPLATAFAFNYYNIPSLNISSNVLLWKNHSDFLDDDQVDDCGYYLYYTWDFDEHTGSRAGSCRISPCNPNDIDPNEFPFESQSVPLTLANFDLVGQAGWMLIVFPPSYGFPSGSGAGAYDPTPNEHHEFMDLMGWVGVKINYGTYSTALEAATMANSHCFPGQYLPQLGVNYIYGPTE